MFIENDFDFQNKSAHDSKSLLVRVDQVSAIEWVIEWEKEKVKEKHKFSKLNSREKKNYIIFVVVVSICEYVSCSDNFMWFELSWAINLVSATHKTSTLKHKIIGRKHNLCMAFEKTNITYMHIYVYQLQA